MVLQEGETISFLWITAREFLEFVESEKHVWTQREWMEVYLEGVRNDGVNCFTARSFQEAPGMAGGRDIYVSGGAK